MKGKRYVVIVALILISVMYSYCEAWDNKVTHPDLSEAAADVSVISKNKGDYLKNLGLNAAIDEYVQWNGNNKKIRAWLREGAELEDAGSYKEMAQNQARFNNHFHNPLKSWNTAGLNDYLSIPFLPQFNVYGESAIWWAQDGNKQQNFREGDWSWQETRAYFFEALNASNDAERQEYFAKTFRGLGHQMHLLQDMAVPAHVRNDAHPLDAILGKVGVLYFESWAAKNADIINAFASNPQMPAVKLDVSKDNLAPITQFIDTDQYIGAAPSTSLEWGLAEYTNANFVSDDTIFTENYNQNDLYYQPYPRYSSQCYQRFDSVDITTGKKRIYLSKVCDGEPVKRFAAAGPLYKYLGTMQRLELKLDDGTYYDYAEKLVPRAVGYSAALLDYFFRGELGVSEVVPIFNSDKILTEITLKIRNYTSTQEVMSNGYFGLAYEYTRSNGTKVYGRIPYVTGMADAGMPVLPYGKNADGTDNNVDDLEIAFDSFPNDITIDEYPSLRFTLGYFGDLGAEKGDTEAEPGFARLSGAVIGKVFRPGKILFNEDWDNGLTGNHAWWHRVRYTLDNPDYYNQAVGGQLVKNNARPYPEYRGYLDNDTYIGMTWPGHEDILPIAITKNTHVQFKIDEMSVSPNSPNGCQFLSFVFNNSVNLWATVQGQEEYCHRLPGDIFIWSYFAPGEVWSQNIHELFSLFEIPFPDTLKLDHIYLWQTTEENLFQRIRLDYIRVIDAKPTPMEAP